MLREVPRYLHTCLTASRDVLSVPSSSEDSLGKKTVKTGHPLQNSLFCQPLLLGMLGNIQGIGWRPASIPVDTVMSCCVCEKLGALGPQEKARGKVWDGLTVL